MLIHTVCHVGVNSSFSISVSLGPHMMRGSKCLLSLYIVFTLPCWNPGARIKMGKVNMLQFVQMVRFRAGSLCRAPDYHNYHNIVNQLYSNTE